MPAKKSLFHRICQQLFHKNKNKSAVQKKRSLHLEPLEERQLLSVSVGARALDAAASEEPSQFGTYRISRDTVTSNPQTVYFTMSGTASYDYYSSASDYQLYTNHSPLYYTASFYDSTTESYSYLFQATIAANQENVDIELRPVNDSFCESNETAILQLLPEDVYDNYYYGDLRRRRLTRLLPRTRRRRLRLRTTIIGC